MADHQEASVTLPSDPASVAAARRYVAEVLCEWGLPDDAETADSVRLIVSELATNAVQHTFGQSPTFTVDIRLEREEWLRVGVTDSHPRWPRRLPAAVQQDNGRGMVIIRWLAVEAGGGSRSPPPRTAARRSGSRCPGPPARRPRPPGLLTARRTAERPVNAGRPPSGPRCSAYTEGAAEGWLDPNRVPSRNVG